MTESIGKKTPFNPSTISGRIGLLFIVFFMLVTVSVGATAWSIETQNKDALIINLAGRQRMLIQGISREVFRIDIEGGDSDKALLKEYISTFDRTLTALLYGGEVPYLPDEEVIVPRTIDENIIAGLDHTLRLWLPFHEALKIFTTTQSSSAELTTVVKSIGQQSPLLLQSADEVVRLFELESAKKISALRMIQVGFFVSALILLLSSFLIIKKSMLNPIRSLAYDAERIGGGKLSTPVERKGLTEIAQLGESLDQMRAALLDSRDALEDRVRKRTRELAALHEVSQEITSRLEIDQVLRSVTDKARELLNCETAFLCLIQDQGNALELKAMSGPERAVGEVRIQEQDPHIQLVLGGSEAVFCNGIECEARCNIIATPYQRSHLASSLRVGGKVIGALCAASPAANAFTLEDKDLLARLANSAAIALENARLYSEAERVGSLEERQRIGVEIHEGLAQMLSFMELEVQDLVRGIDLKDLVETKSDLQTLHRSIHQANQEARYAIARLQDGDMSEKKSFEKVLDEVVDDFSRLGPPRIQLSTEALRSEEIPDDQSDHIIAIIKEAILNARKHSGANIVQVRAFSRVGYFEVQVEDDGRGFDQLTINQDEKRHFGLSIMRSRAARLNGELEIESTLGKGSRVRLIWPRQARLRVPDNAFREGMA